MGGFPGRMAYSNGYSVVPQSVFAAPYTFHAAKVFMFSPRQRMGSFAASVVGGAYTSDIRLVHGPRSIEHPIVL